jgi:hypothetical protein
MPTPISPAERGWSPGRDHVEIIPGRLWARRVGDHFAAVAVHTDPATGTSALVTGQVSAAILLGDHGLAGSPGEVDWLIQTGAVEQEPLDHDHPALVGRPGFGIQPHAWRSLGLDPATVRAAETAAHTTTATAPNLEPPF